MLYPPSAVERAMQIKEVMLRGMYKENDEQGEDD